MQWKYEDSLSNSKSLALARTVIVGSSLQDSKSGIGRSVGAL